MHIVHDFLDYYIYGIYYTLIIMSLNIIGEHINEDFTGGNTPRNIHLAMF